MLQDNLDLSVLEGVSIGSVHVKNSHEFNFIGYRIKVDDAWEPTESYLLFCDIEKDLKRQWSMISLGYTDGVEGGFVERPSPVWVFGRETDASIITLDDFGSIGIEQIPTRPGDIKASFRMLKGVKGGHAYAVATTREVWKRESAEQWILLQQGIPRIDYMGSGNNMLFHHGFDNIDGFSDTDLYATGGHGDMWNFDGEAWNRIDIPTNARLHQLCCALDGFVYVTTNQGTVLKGRASRWKVITQSETDELFEDIAWYRDRVYVSTEHGLFEVSDNRISKANIAKNSPGTFGFMDSFEDVLVCASASSEISYHNDSGWHKLAYRERKQQAPGEPSLYDLIKTMMDKKK